MTDDIVFCAKTVRAIVGQSTGASNVVPFPGREADWPKPEDPESYVERVTITYSATFADTDDLVRNEIAALAKPVQESDDI